MRKFCLLCETIDDQRRSTRRLHDVDTCANDSRHEMALESMSVLMKVNLRTTAHMRARASNCALTSTSLSLDKFGPNGLSHASSCLKHLDFLKVKVPDAASHNEGILSTSVISSSICGTGISTICSGRPGFPTHTTHTKSSN